MNASKNNRFNGLKIRNHTEWHPQNTNSTPDRSPRWRELAARASTYYHCEFVFIRLPPPLVRACSSYLNLLPLWICIYQVAAYFIPLFLILKILKFRKFWFRRKTKDKGQKTKDKRRRTKDEGQKTKDKGKKTKHPPLTRNIIWLGEAHYDPINASQIFI